MSRAALVTILVAFALLAVAMVTSAQDALELRHYRVTEVVEDVRTDQHLMISREGRAAMVVMSGYVTDEEPRVIMGTSGPVEFSDEGVCFVVDDFESNGFMPEVPLVGQRLCWIYDGETDTFYPHHRPDLILRDCGEPHVAEDVPPKLRSLS